ncbi:hypothetical protein CEUSTIGMA_g5098.t1 [Chlamydomonas eustigma]|uniref:Cyclase n=1 Tax=Chlamydomonas eustigma TaxID=1157962 RepID=A0A250X3L0_9CHLO|nr:hypothetical protein CEUSTIGMA_g5098.t1 [Chlamydomonas eustigma]|eukprot:GAX77655.1 hypothetical protein CEUSTIGMA_g5098.t1 [Chlamydomonas eustigma]
MCTEPPKEPDGDCGGSIQHEVTESSITYFDITATIAPELPTWDSGTGLGQGACVKTKDMSKGDNCYASFLSMSAHTGTHIDMPSHFSPQAMLDGKTAEKTDLGLLMGPVLVIEVPYGSNITAPVLKALDIAPEATRVIFKTDSTSKGLMQRTAFESSYTGLTATGAKFLADNTHIKTVGIDYLSVGIYEECAEAHMELFKKDIMVVEGLVLEGVPPGWYSMTCLPLKVLGAEGVPARCILTEYLDGNSRISDEDDDDLDMWSDGEDLFQEGGYYENYEELY